MDDCTCEACRVLRALGEARRAAQVASYAFGADTYAHDAAWNAAYDAWDAAVAASRVAALLVEQTADALVAERAPEQPGAATIATLDAVRLSPDDERRLLADTEAMRAARRTTSVCVAPPRRAPGRGAPMGDCTCEACRAFAPSAAGRGEVGR